jgi:DNA-binding response OmpR family regulator
VLRDLLGGSKPKPGSILVVSDDNTVLSLVGDMLRKRHYRVHVTMNIPETIRFLDSDPPDVVICDFSRPDEGGRQLLEAARLRIGKSAMPPLIFLRDTIEDEALAQDFGAAELILKPFDSTTLLEHVGRLIAQLHRPAK